MARRNNRRCRNCPDEQTPSVATTAAKSAAAKVTSSVIDRSIITADGAGQKLWNHVLYGTSTCIGMMQGYADLGMPGDPLSQLREMISMLAKLQQQLETKQCGSKSHTAFTPSPESTS